MRGKDLRVSYTVWQLILSLTKHICVICVCLHVVVSGTCCVVLCFLVYPVLPVFLDGRDLIASSVFTNVYFPLLERFQNLLESLETEANANNPNTHIHDQPLSVAWYRHLNEKKWRRYTRFIDINISSYWNDAVVQVFSICDKYAVSHI